MGTGTVAIVLFVSMLFVMTLYENAVGTNDTGVKTTFDQLKNNYATTGGGIISVSAVKLLIDNVLLPAVLAGGVGLVVGSVVSANFSTLFVIPAIIISFIANLFFIPTSFFSGANAFWNIGEPFTTLLIIFLNVLIVVATISFMGGREL